MGSVQLQFGAFTLCGHPSPGIMEVAVFPRLNAAATAHNPPCLPRVLSLGHHRSKFVNVGTLDSSHKWTHNCLRLVTPALSHQRHFSGLPPLCHISELPCLERLGNSPSHQRVRLCLSIHLSGNVCTPLPAVNWGVSIALASPAS